MKIVVVKANQDICDVCIQEYGSLEFLDQIIKDNNFGYGVNLTQGQEVFINSEDVGNEDVKEFFEFSKRNPKNGLLSRSTTPVIENEIPLFSTTNITWDSTQYTFDNETV